VTGQLGQHPGVDLVGLAGQRGQAFDLLYVCDLDLPARQLQLVIGRTVFASEGYEEVMRQLVAGLGQQAGLCG
jgi:hypothetical protein